MEAKASRLCQTVPGRTVYHKRLSFANRDSAKDDVKEESSVQPVGSMSDEQDSAASESLDYKGNISDIPAVMLYDFCNAFPTLLHEWMWLVSNFL